MDIQINVKSMSGKNDKYFVKNSIKVKELAKMVADKEGNELTQDNIILVYSGRPLNP